MWRTGSLLALMALVVAVVAISGSGDLGRNRGSSPEFHAARVELDDALGDVAADIAALEQLLEGHAAIGPNRVDPGLLLRRVTERRNAIIATLDSVERAGGDAWRGPMAGLRASVADLEFRVDRVRLAQAESAGTLDELFESWLADADVRLGALSGPTSDSIAGPYDEETRALRVRVDLLADRMAGRSNPASGGDPTTRQAFGKEFIVMRRRLRALVRAHLHAGHAVHD